MRILTLLGLLALLHCSQVQAHHQVECLREHIRSPMIREMIHISGQIQKSLPRDNLKSKRILGKLNVCSKRLNVADFKKLLDIYEEHIFQKLWRRNTESRRKIFMDSFLTLKNNMELCENTGPKTLSRCAREKLKKLEKTFKRLQQDDLFKAVSEFQNVLIWISLTTDRKKNHS